MKIMATSPVSFGVRIDRCLRETVRAGYEDTLRYLYKYEDMIKFRKDLTQRLDDIHHWGDDSISLGLRVYNGGAQQMVAEKAGKTVELTEVIDDKYPLRLLKPLFELTKENFQKLMS
jgi:hypothetical protein